MMAIFASISEIIRIMKKLAFLTALLVSCLCSHPCSAQPKLAFHADSTFKVIQFTDTHIRFVDEQNRKLSGQTYSRISKLIDLEKPDLVVLTGDIVTWNEVSEAWRRLVDTLNVKGVPFLVCFGNHDDEGSLTHEQIAQILKTSKYFMNKLDKSGGLADVRLDVLGNDGKPGFSIYGLDSHSYSRIKGIDGYGWFSFDQVEWFRKDAAGVTKKNGGTPVPAFMFFHIPLPEYDFTCHRCDPDVVGRRGEQECIQAVNTGMFGAIAESGSVIGTSVGHDHDNDYVLVHKGIALCYGRYSGNDTCYNHVVLGSRVFVFRQGSRDFETWIREESGREVEHVRIAAGKLFK
jgi:Predicted phosphohydrolases